MAELAMRSSGLPWEKESRVQAEPDKLTELADEILERCRGEGPANCVARCPLHINARGYVQLAKEGRYGEALQLVREKLPFPGILGYICAHPCELHCKRIDEDSAIRIRDIKRFLADWEPGEPNHILDREADKEERIAVVGAGPAGLLAAHDLCRKGYQVTVFERDTRIGGCLVQKIPAYRLPPAVTERDLSIIDELNIRVLTGVEVGRDISVAELCSTYHAVLLMSGFSGGQNLLEDASQFRRSVRDTLWSDPLTCETSVPGVFSGGEAVSGPRTVIDALALGRRTAESAHRFLQGEDLRGSRESPLPAPLLWRLDVDEAERRKRERAPVMLQPHNEALEEAATREEAERCLDCECGLCVKDCEFLAKHCNSPKDIARRIKTDLDKPDVQKMVYSCNICSLCSAVCPEDLDTGRLLLKARQTLVEREAGPLPEHKPIVGYWRAGVSDTFSLVMSEPGRQRSKRLFFTGCGLPATSPKNTLAVYEQLRRDHPGTGVLMLCCGAPVDLLGMEDNFGENRSTILRMMESVGAEELITACPDCTHCLKENLPEISVTTIWERLAPTWDVPRKREGATVSIHDSCKARHEPGLHDAVRTLIQRGGGKVEDIEYRGDMARCCGFGGMIFPVDPELSRAVTGRRTAESDLPMVTYCAGCRMALRGCGKDSLHILDFLFSSDWTKTARRKPPGTLGRYWNRLRTKWAFQRLRPVTHK